MGLDQNWFAVPAGQDPSDDNCDAVELHYHRKVPALEDWMANLYREKGGEAEVFNCQLVKIEPEDLDALQQTIDDGDLNTQASGFFWGSHMDEDIPDIQEAVDKARHALRDKMDVYYTSWW